MPGRGVGEAEVRHVAALAGLRLAPEEVARLALELTDILGHVAELAGADAAGGEPAPAAEGPAPLRPDRVDPVPLALSPAELAPAWEEGFFTLPRLGAMEAPPPGAPASGLARARPDEGPR